jgi:hypothetical protein
MAATELRPTVVAVLTVLAASGAAFGLTVITVVLVEIGMLAAGVLFLIGP